MSYPSEVKEKFVQLRISGMSFRKISEMLSVGINTLTAWHREMAETIANLQAIDQDGILQQFALAKSGRIEVLCEMLQKIKDELKRRSFDDISSAQLLRLYIDYHQALNEEICTGICIKTNTAFDALRTSVEL